MFRVSAIVFSSRPPCIEKSLVQMVVSKNTLYVIWVLKSIPVRLFLVHKIIKDSLKDL